MGIIHSTARQPVVKMLILAASLLYLAPAVSADGCCIPEQWEADMLLVVGSVDSSGNVTLIEGTMHSVYDAKNKKIVYYQNITYNGNPVQQTIIEDYNARVRYVIGPKVNAVGCMSMVIGEWLSNCIPDNSTSADYYYGLGANMVNVRGYRTDYGAFSTAYAVTADTCVPVAENTWGHIMGADTHIVTNFGNVKAGISDMNAFSVPANCANTGPPIPGIGGRRSVFRGYI